VILQTFFVIVLANLMPLGRADGGLLVHALSLTGSIHGGGRGVVVVSTAHRPLAHVITETQTLGQVARIERGIRGWRVLVLRGVSSQRSLGIGSEGIVVGHSILMSDVLENLLIDVQLGPRVGDAVLVVERVPEVGVAVAGHAAVAAVRRAVHTLRVVTKVIRGLTLALVGVSVGAVHGGIRHRVLESKVRHRR